MKEYEITIEEVISQPFIIEANSLEEAMEIAEEKYNKCEIVLESPSVCSKQMSGYDYETQEATDWVEF